MQGVFQENIYLIAELGCGLADSADGEFEHGGGADADCGHAPGFQAFFDVDDDAVAIEVKGIDGETHGEGVDAVGGMDPEAASAGERGWICRHQAAEAGPVSARDD